MSERRIHILTVVLGLIEARSPLYDQTNNLYAQAKQKLDGILHQLPKDLPFGCKWVLDSSRITHREIDGCSRIDRVFEFTYPFLTVHDPLHRRKLRKDTARRWAGYGR